MSDDDGFIAHLRSGENEAEHHAADEIERLRAAITEAVKTLEAEASNECMCLMVADDLNDAMKGTTDDE